MMPVCHNLDEVRGHIDAIDRQLVGLIAQRGALVMQAAQFKTNSDEVKAPQRVEQVIAKVRALANELEANADITETIYRAMIAAFINAELAQHAALTGDTSK